MVAHPGEQVKRVRCTKDSLRVDLADGRTIMVPLAWYPRLLHATARERANWRVAGGGYGIHWPDIDEDLSVEGLLRGLPAPHRPVLRDGDARCRLAPGPAAHSGERLSIGAAATRELHA